MTLEDLRQTDKDLYDAIQKTITYIVDYRNGAITKEQFFAWVDFMTGKDQDVLKN